MSNKRKGNIVGIFLTWGVVGILAGIVAFSGTVAWWFDPSRAERARKRRAKANQKWVREALARHNVTGVIQEAETIAAFYKQMEDPWKHLESK